MSEWVVHFVHGMNPGLVRINGEGETEPTPVAFDLHGNGIVLDHQTYRHPSRDFELSAFDVLLRIIDDGYLQTSWSLRERNKGEDVVPTIYGWRSALCFTEMPLHALTDYQSKRAGSGYVEKYAIAVKKHEFFSAGGRKVISGLSAPHREMKLYEDNRLYFCRHLLPECGLGEHEQYRYVAMNIGGGKYVDWSHEREWRWTKDYRLDNFTPGLPLWMDLRECDTGRNNVFSEIIVITESDDQIPIVVNKLRSLHDAGSNQFGVLFDAKRLKSTKVTSFSRVAREGVRHIEDLEFPFESRIRDIFYNDEEIERAKEVYELSRLAAQEVVQQIKFNEDESDFDFCGWAELVLLDSHNKFVQALVGENIAKVSAGDGYVINVNDRSLVQQSMYLSMRGCEAAGEVFLKELGLDYIVKSFPD
ncbi:hypothetical protein AB6N16_13785 [Pseudomonas marginalis]